MPLTCWSWIGTVVDKAFNHNGSHTIGIGMRTVEENPCFITDLVIGWRTYDCNGYIHMFVHVLYFDPSCLVVIYLFIYFAQTMLLFQIVLMSLMIFFLLQEVNVL